MEINEFIDLAVNIQSEEYVRLWTEAEDNILRRLHGYITDRQIAEILKRSELAVRLRWKRNLHLPPPSRDPDYITTYKIAKILGVDNHVTPSWVDRGIMPGEYIPRNGDTLWRRVRLDIFLNWVMEPMNWIWFNIHKVKNSELRIVLEQMEKKWGDEWWNTNQVADFHHVDNKDVLRFIKTGRIIAIQAHNRSGRNQDRWANWFILKSEATRPDLKF